jgi:hypothetical protein
MLRRGDRKCRDSGASDRRGCSARFEGITTLPNRSPTKVLLVFLALSVAAFVGVGLGAWHERQGLDERREAVMARLPEPLLSRLRMDLAVRREILGTEQAALDSLKGLGFDPPAFLRPQVRILASQDSGDLLQGWLDRRACWDPRPDTLLDPQLPLRRAQEDSLREQVQRQAKAFRPDGLELWVASALLLLDRGADELRPPGPERMLARLLQAVSWVGVLRPGDQARLRRAMVGAERQALGREVLRWRALDRLALSWGVEDSLLWTIRETAREQGLEAALERARPQDPVWVPLLDEAMRYRRLEIAAESLPSRFPGAAALASDTILRAGTLRRLRELGYAADSGGKGMAMPLGAFQENRGLKPTGKWDDTTWLALVVPDSSSRARICSTLARLTRSPWHRDSFCIRVNIPEFVLDCIQDGRSLRRHRVVVGKDTVGRFTPVLSSLVRHVVVNPQWHVPVKIFRDEILAGKSPDIAALRSQGYEPEFDKQGRLMGVYQPPGEENALGKIKFLFDNPFGVYMHDTPSRHLFARRVRAFSHGCVRVEDPVALGEFLLARDGHRFAGKLDSLIGEEDQKWLKLNVPVPVHFEYRTVSTDSLGRVRFLRDLYGEARERAKAQAEGRKGLVSAEQQVVH